MAATVLLNICRNLINNKSRTQLWTAFVIFYVTLRSHYKRKRRHKAVSGKLLSFKPEPLVTFSGGGQLGFYYQGVAAFLKDNFDLEHVRFAGISAGSTAAASLAARLPTEASMVFGLKWFKLVGNRRLKMFLMDPERLCKIGTDICDDFGITDLYIRTLMAKTDCYYGVTNISRFPPRHELLSTFESRHESFYAMSCSMRVLPFFKSVGYYKGSWLLDGGFTAMFSIPPDAHPERIIRVTPCSRIDADVQPNAHSPSHFKVIDAFKMPSLDEIYEQFERGYRDAARAKSKLLAKGLNLKSDAFQNLLEEHMAMLRKYGHQIFGADVDALQNMDFKHLTPTISPEIPTKSFSV